MRVRSVVLSVLSVMLLAFPCHRLRQAGTPQARGSRGGSRYGGPGGSRGGRQDPLRHEVRRLPRP